MIRFLIRLGGMILAALFTIIVLAASKEAFGQNNGALLPSVPPSFLNASGVIASGAKLCTTATGSSTNLATYSDAALTSALPNPITLNALGVPQTSGGTSTAIYIQSRSYRITLYAAGTGNTCNGTAVGSQIWQRDNVFDFAQVGVISSLNNRQFCTTGATAGARITAAIALLPSTGGIVDCTNLQGAQTISTDVLSGLTKPIELQLGCATYTLGAGLTLPGNSKIVGIGGQGTQSGVDKCSILKKSGSFAGLTISGVGAVVSNIAVDGNSQTGGGIVMTGGRSELHDVTVHNDGGVGVRVGADSDAGNTNKVVLENVTSYSNASHGLYISSHTTTAPDANIGVYINFEATGNGGDGVRINQGSSNTFVGGQAQTNTGYGYNFVSNIYDSGNILTGVYAESNNALGVGCSAGPCDVFIGATSNGNRLLAYSVTASKISETSFSASRALRINDETLRINATTAVEIDTTAASNADINLNPGGTGQVTSGSFIRTLLSGAGVLGFRQYYLTNKRAAWDYSEADGSMVIANYNNAGVINFAPQGASGTVRSRINNDGNFEFVSGQSKIITTTGSLLDVTIQPDGGDLAIVAATSITSSGLVLGAPTGGNKGLGAMNAAGVVEIGGATGTASGTNLQLGKTVAFGAGTSGTAMTTTTKGAGSGPTTAQTVVNYLKINIGGADYYVPLVQIVFLIPRKKRWTSRH